MPSRRQRTSRADVESRPSRWAGFIVWAGLGAAAIAIVIAWVVVLAGRSPARRETAAAQGPSGAAARPSPGIASGRASLVAVARVPLVHLYRSPSAAASPSVFQGRSALGVPAVFLVKHDDGAWLDVYVARRPDGSTGWIRSSEVTLEKDDYKVLVSLSLHRLTAMDGSRILLRTPVATGTAATPTPVGTYFITELLRQPDPSGAYGPYAYGLSAFSNVLSSFGGGPGQIGLHGTDEPALIGTAASNGCIRVPNTVVERLAGELPLGTPVVITS